jgi:hypothetical protein
VAFEQRQIVNYFSTQLSVAASLTDTTMRAPAFTNLDSALGAKYVPLVLHDDQQGVFEIVWASGHAVGSDTITVARGKEGSTARAWPSGTRVECAPTAYDVALASVTSSLPTDAPIGMRSMRGDKFDVVERANGFWAPSAGVAIAADVGPNMFGTAVPDGAVLTMRSQYVAPFNTNATGDKTVNFKTPFPNACLSAWFTSVTYNACGPFVVFGMTASSVSFTVYNGNATRQQLNSVSCLLNAVGW